MRLSQKLDPEMVLVSPDVADRDGLFQRFGELFANAGLVTSAEEVVQRLMEREAILSTGIGGGVAVPHAQLPGLGRLVMAASNHPDGLDYPALDDQPVQLVFCLLGDANTTADHLAGLARLARLARRRAALEPLITATDGQAFVAALEDLEGA
ncbi:MAG: PTS sugar transporter subunit IIA [Acidobacteriota bacterium]|nr:PTS sugar transporter subunit IIA [Acidobacteriota bacterium]